jgi:hypothetical protein
VTVATAERDRLLDLSWGWASLAFELALTFGAFLAVAAWRPAAVIMIGAFTLGVAAHVALAVVKYRRTMTRPWPKVQPLPDDDDWD